jgi:RimJ/RimL family protein N-acetyltransferase
MIVEDRMMPTKEESNKHYSKMGAGSPRLDTRVGLFIIDGLDWPNGSCGLSWGVFKDCRRKGYGTTLVQVGVDFCFEVLNLRRVECEILHFNVPSMRCADKAGFVHEGTKRQTVFRCGQEIHSHIYGLLRSDWLKSKRVMDMESICNKDWK